MQRISVPPACADCGYDLSGTPIVRNQITCPECGCHRIRVFRWWEPRSSLRTGAVCLIASPAAGVPAALVACLLLGRWDPRDLAAACAVAALPFCGLGVLLAWVRPHRAAAVLMVITAAVLAAVYAVFAGVFLYQAPPAVRLATVVVYVLVPVPGAYMLVRAAYA